MKSRNEQSSRLVSYWLRHDPADGGLDVDEHGWTGIAGLTAALRSRGVELNVEELVTLSGSFDKKRWEIDLAGGRIRATHGHSFPVVLEDKAAVPPSVLYHGTAVGALEGILEKGLAPMSRQQVHLSDTVDAALAIGRRHGQPLIAEVDAAALSASGASFYHTGEHVWLSPAIPLRYISFRPWTPIVDGSALTLPNINEALKPLWTHASGAQLFQGRENYYLIEEKDIKETYTHLQDWIRHQLLPDQRALYNYR